MNQILKFFILNVLIGTILIISLNKMVSKKHVNIQNFREKYIQFECDSGDICGGWGDRLKGLMSTYAFSLLTGRKFLIKMTKNCPLKNSLEPNKINWDHEQFKLTNFTKKILRLGKNSHFYYQNATSLLSEYSNIDLIVIKSHYMFSKTISENPWLKSQIKKLGYEQHNFSLVYQFRNWYDKLFLLNRNLRERYKIILKRLKPNGKTVLLCAQVRIGDHGHVGEIDPKTSEHFWNFINSKFLSKNKNLKYSIFVTSDREHVKQEAKFFFKNESVFYIKGSSVHIDKIKGQNGCFGWQNVIFEFHLMKNCDIGVVSHSGFGILSMWNRQDPFKNVFVFTKKDQKQLKNDYWLRTNLTFLKYADINDIYFP